MLRIISVEGCMDSVMPCREVGIDSLLCLKGRRLLREFRWSAYDGGWDLHFGGGF